MLQHGIYSATKCHGILTNIYATTCYIQCHQMSQYTNKHLCYNVVYTVPINVMVYLQTFKLQCGIYSATKCHGIFANIYATMWYIQCLQMSWYTSETFMLQLSIYSVNECHGILAKHYATTWYIQWWQTPWFMTQQLICFINCANTFHGTHLQSTTDRVEGCTTKWNIILARLHTQIGQPIYPVNELEWHG